MSRALADAARRARLSRRGRNSLGAGGFGARRGARLARRVAIASFLVLVATPAFLAALYYGLFASDQYVSEAQFTVMGGEVQSQDGFGAVTGIPMMAIVQDTQIVANYIHSRAAIEKLEQRVRLRQRYARDDIDWLARMPLDQPAEKFQRYWRKMASVTIEMPAGIVEVRVRAFSSQDAAEIGQAIVEISEQLINELNLRMNADLLRNTEIELQRSADRLGKARAALETARNEEGLLDAQRTADALTKLITDARGALLQLQQEQAAQLRYVNANSPQMRVLRTRIDAARAQVQDLESQLTRSKISAERDGKALSASMTTFDMLDLERQIAERLFAGSAAAVEIARIIAERKAMYLNTFVWPTPPEDALYPRRILYPTLWAAGALVLWGALIGLFVAARNHMA